MEKLHRRSDGACETPSGLFAVTPRVVSGVTNGTKWFEFQTSATSQITRLEWPSDAAIVIVPQDVAKALVRNGWASGITDAHLDDHNAVADEFAAGNGDAGAGAGATTINQTDNPLPIPTNAVPPLPDPKGTEQAPIVPPIPTPDKAPDGEEKKEPPLDPIAAAAAALLANKK